MAGRPIAEEFLRRFGVEHAATLRRPATLPPRFLRRCRSYGAATAANFKKRRLDAYLEELAAGRVTPVEIKKINATVGRGLFARRELKAGDWIGEYAGTLSRDWGAAFNPYLFKYPFETPFAIDGKKTGNELRFANHSARRANAARAYLLHDGILHAVLLAKKTIPIGAQILFDYGAAYWRGWHMHLITGTRYNAHLWRDAFLGIFLGLKGDSARRRTASNIWTRFDGLKDFGARDARAKRHGA